MNRMNARVNKSRQANNSLVNWLSDWVNKNIYVGLTEWYFYISFPSYVFSTQNKIYKKNKIEEVPFSFKAEAEL